MEEWVVAGLVGAVGGYGVRVWQEKAPKVVKQPAEAVVRSVGSALGTGASLGGRAAGAGASLGAGAVRGGVATVVSGVGAVSRVAMRRSAGGAGAKTLTRVPVSDGKESRATRTRRPRAGSSQARPAPRQAARTSSRRRSRPS
jgi:hypothetical protein